jgi:hypothetical protein
MKKLFLPFFMALLMTGSGFGQTAKPITHLEAMEILRGCRSRKMLDCDGAKIESVILRYRRGDAQLLYPLLKAAEFSDGALSEDLAEFYSDELKVNTTGFLIAVSGLASSTQETIVMLAALGGDPDEMTQVQRRLRKLARNKGPSAQLATRLLNALPDGKTYPNNGKK